MNSNGDWYDPDPLRPYLDGLPLSAEELEALRAAGGENTDGEPGK